MVQPAKFKRFEVHDPKERPIMATHIIDKAVQRTIEKEAGKVATDPHKESFYQARIMKWLKQEYPDAFVWKAQAGPYCRQGIPDICAIIDGHFFGFEVKRPKLGRLSKIQEQTLKEIEAAGGTTAVVSYPEEVERTILTYRAARSAAITAHADMTLAREIEKLDTAMTNILAVCGMNAEQLQEKFMAGYELRPPEDREGGENSAGIS